MKNWKCFGLLLCFLCNVAVAESIYIFRIHNIHELGADAKPWRNAGARCHEGRLSIGPMRGAVLWLELDRPFTYQSMKTKIDVGNSVLLGWMAEFDEKKDEPIITHLVNSRAKVRVCSEFFFFTSYGYRPTARITVEKISKH